jgi:hypothetical protein|tara:strand:+ start:635 stop:1066 length:432 start_codon:yes stop_codon:yes gene_type:complete
MKKLLLLLFLYAIPVKSQPITPAFTTGTSSSTTNTTTSISEFITSTDYFGNGYEYTVTGVGVSMGDSESISPPITTINGTVNGEAQTWTGLDLNNKPNWTVVDGNAFQFTETYRAPGSISNITTIQRNIESESVVTTTSVFSQ